MEVASILRFLLGSPCESEPVCFSEEPCKVVTALRVRTRTSTLPSCALRSSDNSSFFRGPRGIVLAAVAEMVDGFVGESSIRG